MGSPKEPFDFKATPPSPAPRPTPSRAPRQQNRLIQRNGSLVLRWIALILVLLGGALVLYYWAIYDVTVPLPRELWHTVVGENPRDVRIYNTGRMNNRLVSIIVGFGCLGLGIVAWMAGRIRR